MKKFLQEWGTIIIGVLVATFISFVVWGTAESRISVNNRIENIEKTQKNFNKDMEQLFENDKYLLDKINSQQLNIRILPLTNSNTNQQSAPHDWMNSFPENEPMVPLSPADNRM